MRRRDVYLRIERLSAYSPVAPDEAEHHRHRRDCMRNHGHEDGTIPEAEVDRRRFDALVYREYLDAAYTVPRTDKLIDADVKLPITGRDPNTLTVQAPADANVAPPGRCMLFILNAYGAVRGRLGTARVRGTPTHPAGSGGAHGRH